jgi:murein DD-endopeptidase MepM/ murein hydrolase activator NlpD
MTRIRRRHLGVTLVTILVGLLPAGAAAAEASSPDLATVRAQVAAATERVSAARAKADEASAAYFAAEGQSEDLADAVVRLQDQLDVARGQLDGIVTQLREFAVQEYTRRADLPTAAALAGGNLNDIVASLAYAGAIGGRKRDVLDDYRRAAANLDATAKQADARKAEQDKVVADRDAKNRVAQTELAKLQTEQAALAAVLAPLEAGERARLAEEARQRLAAEAAKREAARQAAAEAKRLADEAKRRQAAEDAARAPVPGTTPRSVDGAFTCPLQGSSFTDTWGQARAAGRSHKGTDMTAPTGTPVYAPVGGTVTDTFDAAGGQAFNLAGDDGNFYYGAHLSRFGAAGRVSAGTVVGYVGMTGNASIPHLHFEIHLGGRGNPVNPYATLIKYC